jgi:hypothetical protein
MSVDRQGGGGFGDDLHGNLCRLAIAGELLSDVRGLLAELPEESDSVRRMASRLLETVEADVRQAADWFDRHSLAAARIGPQEGGAP